MKDTQETITEININGLHGRMLQLSAPEDTRREIVLIYGLHSSIERMHTTAVFHNQFGSVTMPDLPGFGGMDSFYSIGMKPTIDNYADYLFTFMRSRGSSKPVTFIAMSFGFLVVTRMLQKHPEMQEKVDDLISIVGFGRHSDFLLQPGRKKVYLVLSRLFATRPGSAFVSFFVFNPLSLRLMFALFRTFNPKYKHTLGEQRKAAERMELDLWQSNDARTKFYTYALLFSCDLTRHQPKINLVVHDMHAPTDQYFDATRVTETLKSIYASHYPSVANTKLHAPSVLGGTEEIEAMYSPEIKTLLSK